MASRSVRCRVSPTSSPPVSSGSRRSIRAAQLGERQRAEPDGGQLDGERHAVEPPAQPDHVGPVRVGDREPGQGGGRPQGEQLDGVARRLGRGVAGFAVVIGKAEGWECRRPDPPVSPAAGGREAGLAVTSSGSRLVASTVTAASR